MLPHPGSWPRSLRLAPQDLVNFTNDSAASCSVVVMHGDSRHIVLAKQEVQRGQTVSRITPPPGTAIIAISASQTCTSSRTVSASWENP